MNDTFCPGVLLQDVELSGIFSDSKTFPDKPTLKTLNETYAAFAQLGSGNLTIAAIEQFVEQNFKGEGLELEQIPIEGFNATPALLDGINDPIYKGWVSVVNEYWTLLIRQTNQSALCNGDCESSLIPLNNTIVVPGGRYREIYYWDSYWILNGLLKSQLYEYATDLVTNFMDFIDTYGFVPNGGRKYYLNRSQPPMFVQMLDLYVKETGNTTILERALPLASTEMQWWSTNRSVSVTSPFSNRTFTMYLYNVTNTAPRPEGYQEDFETVMGSNPALDEAAQGELYGELASGAETGWDYSSRWCKQPLLNVSDNDPALRTLNVKGVVPVELNSLLAGDHALLAGLYELYANSSDANSTIALNATTQAAYHRNISIDLSDAVLDIHYDFDKAWFYDFNLTANTRSDLFTMAGTYPLWQNITPSQIQNNETEALAFASGLRYLLGKYAGLPSVATLLNTGLNWDFPNAWPPHAYTSIKTFEALGRLYPNASTTANLTVGYADVRAGQLGLNESAIPAQDSSLIGNQSLETQEAQGKPWPLGLSIEYANRYMQAAFCTWYSTGGEISGLLNQLPLSQLNASGTYTAGTTGVMFEKFNASDVDASGGGGEYTVQIGFGWTNGVVLWTAANYGQYLPMPTCPQIPIMEIQNGQNVTVSDNGTVASTNSSSLFVGWRVPRK